tara:strand:- start:7059 stop:7379 length:321 start_codon:yes stop_codon:yes gene_type:complete
MLDYKMRSKGSKTNIKCWKLEVVNQNNIIYENEYSTLNEIANELGITYNQVVELSSGRKKQPTGRFDTSYRFIKLNKKSEKLNKECEEENKEEKSDELPPSQEEDY